MNGLNLARKWRPKSFDQIVGQQISIRMLQNGLFLNKLFPVYLFAGQRGCGKTTTARVFGAAVNCQNLNKFQADPNNNKIPCLECQSCQAMQNSNHPDFIEIDAASHTGVDNVRQIIEASAYMPLLGQKKIYLIDEAHMLSKAAFNALLKILEEPPASVLFILATTDVPKVPDTVLSRCFQVIFTAIEGNDLHGHLQAMCERESITIEPAAIDLIISETEGSARDAINLLERVRFSESVVTQDTILKVLGKISTKEICVLFDFLLGQDPVKVLAQLNAMNFETLAAQNLWDMLVELCRALLWIKYGIKDLKSGLNQSIDELSALAKKCSINRLHAIFQLLWTQEELFLRTNKKHVFLEMVLLQICEQTNVADLQELVALAKIAQNAPRITSTPPRQGGLENIQIADSPALASNLVQTISNSAVPAVALKEGRELDSGSMDGSSSQSEASVQSNVPAVSPGWADFLQKLNADDIDPMLNSILVQAKFVKFDSSSKKVEIQLNSSSRFFKDKIDETKAIWITRLQQYFSDCVGFTLIDAPVQPVQPKYVAEKSVASVVRPGVGQGTPVNRAVSPDNTIVNVKDGDKWPLANLILNSFPGVVKKSGGE